ncbi:UDP-2,3-diacylglucosamine diphosphatase LpxI [bacterium]|nr:UDP-2,3-diacylglucosamine diphosphatase LpxI [bacterium]
MATLEQHLCPHRRFSDSVGLLAGGGRFPVLFAEAAREQGIRVVCVGIEGNADPALANSVDTFLWNGVTQLGSMIRKFKREGIDCVVMAGKIQKTVMFERFRLLRNIPDWRFIKFFFSAPRQDNRDDTLMLGLIDEFARDGIRIASALEVCPELLASAGCLTGRKPRPQEIKDIAFGWHLAKEMGRLDVGQSVAVRERAALAIEAIEGTDKAIERAGILCPAGGFTVVKVAKPQQDMRFDVPTIGISTIETMKKAGGSCLAIEAGRTIILDAEQTIARADNHGIAIVSLTAEEAQIPEEQPPLRPAFAERREQRRPA